MADEKPSITPEQIAAYHQQLEQQKQQALEQCAKDLIELAASRGFVIVAFPQLVPAANGNVMAIGATWGVADKPA